MGAKPGGSRLAIPPGQNGGKENVNSSSTRGGNQGSNQGPTSRKEGYQEKKYEEKGKKKFSKNCFVCGKQGHCAQDCYQKVMPGELKGKDNASMTQASPSQEN